MTAASSRTLPEVIAQTAAGWPDADSGWLYDAHLVPEDASNGTGAISGSASFRLDLGQRIKRVGQYYTGVSVLWQTYPGMSVRILKAVASGGISVAGTARGSTWEVLWNGVIDDVDVQLDDTGNGHGHGTVSAVHVSALLARLYVARGWALGGSTGDYRSLAASPVVNPTRAGNMGGTETLGGLSVGMFGHLTEVRSRWKMYKLVNYLLYWHARPQVYGLDDSVSSLTWVTDGTAATLLDWDVPGPVRLQGRSIASILNELCGTDRGLSWDVLISGSIAVVSFRSITPEAISIGDASVPAADTVDLTTAGNVFMHPVRLHAGLQGYDEVIVQGERPLLGMTLECSTSSTAAGIALIPDTWDSGDDAGDSDIAWRLWRINPAWDGSQPMGYGSGGVRWQMSAAGNLPEANPQHDNASATPLEINLEMQTPLARAGATVGTAPLAQPRVIAVDDDGLWDDLTHLVSVRLDADDPHRIEIGLSTEEAEIVQDYLASGSAARLFITIGVREPSPLTAVWQRERQEWLKAVPRTIAKEMPGRTQWITLAGTILGVAAGAADVVAVEDAIRDDSEDLLADAARLAGRRGALDGSSASWREQGVYDVSLTYQPGVVVATIDGWDVRGLIVRRTWNFIAGYTEWNASMPPGGQEQLR